AQQFAAVGQLQGDDVTLPEVGATVQQQQTEQAADQQEIEGQGSPAQPGQRAAQGLGAARRGAHSSAYLRRRRWRTTSATVLITKVMRNSSRAARKSTR